MADEIDIANDLFNQQLQQAIEKLRQGKSQSAGAKICVECGDDIPEARQQLGFKWCVYCAEEMERR